MNAKRERDEESKVEVELAQLDNEVTSFFFFNVLILFGEHFQLITWKYEVDFQDLRFPVISLSWSYAGPTTLDRQPTFDQKLVKQSLEKTAESENSLF